jgi:hypothetical protein
VFCFVTTVAKVILFRYFGPYGTVYMNACFVVTVAIEYCYGILGLVG